MCKARQFDQKHETGGLKIEDPIANTEHPTDQGKSQCARQGKAALPLPWILDIPCWLLEIEMGRIPYCLLPTES